MNLARPSRPLPRPCEKERRRPCRAGLVRQRRQGGGVPAARDRFVSECEKKRLGPSRGWATKRLQIPRAYVLPRTFASRTVRLAAGFIIVVILYIGAERCMWFAISSFSVQIQRTCLECHPMSFIRLTDQSNQTVTSVLAHVICAKHVVRTVELASGTACLTCRASF
jgi:hypothetical protein